MIFDEALTGGETGVAPAVGAGVDTAGVIATGASNAASGTIVKLTAEPTARRLI
jgi:hypothetical protein